MVGAQLGVSSERSFRCDTCPPSGYLSSILSMELDVDRAWLNWLLPSKSSNASCRAQLGAILKVTDDVALMNQLHPLVEFTWSAGRRRSWSSGKRAILHTRPKNVPCSARVRHGWKDRDPTRMQFSVGNNERRSGDLPSIFDSVDQMLQRILPGRIPNGYQHEEWYVRAAQNIPCVIGYTRQ